MRVIDDNTNDFLIDLSGRSVRVRSRTSPLTLW